MGEREDFYALLRQVTRAEGEGIKNIEADTSGDAEAEREERKGNRGRGDASSGGEMGARAMDLVSQQNTLDPFLFVYVYPLLSSATTKSAEKLGGR